MTNYSKLTKALSRLKYLDSDQHFILQLSSDFPDYHFTTGRKFAFRPPHTIVIGPHEESWQLLLLHELGHAMSGHRSFSTHIARLKMEVEAWTKAESLASKYQIPWNETRVQEELDTYRNWLHQKSRCPSCGLTRFQTTDGQYHCPRCESFKRPSSQDHGEKSYRP